MKKFIALALVVIMMMALLAGCGAKDDPATASTDNSADSSSAEPVVLKFGHHYANDGVFGDIANDFKATVEELSGGSIKVEVYSDGVLGTEEQLIEQLQGGTVDLTITGTMLQTTVPMLGLVQGPFLFKDWEHAKTVMTGELGEEIYAMFEQGGLKAICSFGEGFRHFVLVKPIESMDDFAGYRMRMASYKNMLALADALGCATTNSPMGEVFTSLQTGVFDGCDAVYTAITDYSWQEPANYVLESAHAFSASAICISTKTWDKLTDEQKAIIEEACVSVSDRAWAAAEQIEADAKASIADDVEFIIPSEEFRNEMAEASYSVWEDMFASVEGMEDLYNRIQDAAK